MAAPTRAGRAPIAPATGAFLKAAPWGVETGARVPPDKDQVLLALGVSLGAGAEVEGSEGVPEGTMPRHASCWNAKAFANWSGHVCAIY